MGSNLYCFPPTGRSRPPLRRAGIHGFTELGNHGFVELRIIGWGGTEEASLVGEALYLSGCLCLCVRHHSTKLYKSHLSSVNICAVSSKSSIMACAKGFLFSTIIAA